MSTMALNENQRPWRTVTVYAAMLLATVFGFFLIRHFGESLEATAVVSTATGAEVGVAHRNETLLHVLLALVTMIAAAVFAMMVIMAVVTTITTTPIFQMINRESPVPNSDQI